MSIDADLAAAIALAETEAAARVAAAVASAQIAATATTQSANIQAEADETVATTAANAQRAVATTNAQADVQVAGIRSVADQDVALTNRAGTQYSADRDLDIANVQQDGETERLEMTLAFAQDKWNQIFPLIEGFLSGPSQGGGGAGQQAQAWTALVTALGSAPWISQGGVWTPSQVQSQVNQVYARSDARAQTQIHDSQVDLAGRGFSSSSPLLDLLTFGYESEAIRSSVEGAQQVYLQAAQANAGQVLDQQKARQVQYQANEQAYVDLDRVLVELATGTLSAVAQIVSATVR